MATLTKLKIDSLLKAGKDAFVHDGRGLYLKVMASGYASWVYRYKTGESEKKQA